MNIHDSSSVDDSKFQEHKERQSTPRIAEVKQERTSIDGGYGWFVVLGCFLYHAISSGIERSDGIFFLQFVKRFGKSAQLSALPGAIMSTLNLALAPIAGIVCNRYSARTSVMVGGLLMATGCILNGYATNFYFLFFSHSLLLGVGRGLSYAPGLIIVAMYFEKRNGLAIGVGTSGAGVGTFLLVPVAQFLFENYGYQGAFLIFGGMALNVNLAGMLYRPLSIHHRLLRSSTVPLLQVDHVNSVEAIVNSETSLNLVIRSSLYSNHSDFHASQEIAGPHGLTMKHTQDAKQCQSQAKWCQSNAKEHLGQEKQHQDLPLLGESCFTSALKTCFPTEVRVDDNSSSRKLCHLYLLKNSSFLLYCIAVWLFSMALKSDFMFLPVLVKSKGNSESEAALVLSISGAVDCVSRIGAGYFLDISLFRRYRPVIYSLVIMASSCLNFILPFMQSLASFLAVCSVFGFLTGVLISQKSLILVDILGLENMMHSLGLLICFQSFGVLMGPPLSGAMRDHFGSFAEAFYLSGTLMLTSGMLMLASNVFLSKQRQISTHTHTTAQHCA